MRKALQTLVAGSTIGIGLAFLCVPANSAGPCVVAGASLNTPSSGRPSIETKENSGAYAGCPPDVRDGQGGRAEAEVFGPCVIVGVTEDGQGIETDRDTGVYGSCPPKP